MTFQPRSVQCSFFIYLDHINNIYFFKQTFRINKKIEWLKAKQLRIENSQITSQIKSLALFQIRFHRILNLHYFSVPDDSAEQKTVCISPNIFNEVSSFDLIHDDWFINLSNIDIPQEVY